MKTIGAALITIIGVAAIVFGVMFIMKAGDSEERVAKEIAPLQISQVNATYGQISGQIKAATDPAKVQQLTLQKLSLGLAQSNIGTIDFVKNSGILNIVLGAGFVLSGLAMFMKRN